MKTGVVDIEADGLYPTKVHCIVVKDTDTGKRFGYPPHKLQKGLEKLQEFDKLVFHNGIGYDLPVLKKLLGFEFEGRIIDTLIMSRELLREKPVPRQLKEELARKKEQAEEQEKLFKEDNHYAIKELINEEGAKYRTYVMNDGSQVHFRKDWKSQPHSVETWAYRLKYDYGVECDTKVEYEDWDEYDEKMLQRCVGDVELQTLIYKQLKQEMKKQGYPNKAMIQNFEFFTILKKQADYGWKVDLERAERYVRQLNKWMGWIGAALDKHLPYLPVIKQDRTDEEGNSEGFQNPFTKAGKPNSRLISWLTNNNINHDFIDYIGGPFCRVEFRKVSINSDKEIKEFLLEGGWEPEEWNFSKTKFDEQGRPQRTGPKLSADDPFIGVDGKVGRLICKHVQVKHRWSNLKGYIKRLRDDGRLESRVSGLANTGRVKHANLANVPKPDSFFGKQMRRVFVAEEGRVLVSADAASCQDRMLVSRAKDEGVSDEIFEDMILNGDKSKGTDSHTRAMHEINNIFRDKGIPEIIRGDAKNFSYAYKFNAADKKLGRMAGITEEKRAKEVGGMIRAAFDKVFQAQVELEKILVGRWKQTARLYKKKVPWKGKILEFDEFKDGKIRGLDGRPIKVKSEKDVLVYQVQSDEAIMMAKANLIVDAKLKQKYKDGEDYKQVCFYHDEISFEAKPEIAEDVKRMLEESIREASDYFNLTLQQRGDGEIGNNWAEIH